jgi:protein arginine N-methyltransferase 3
VFRFLQDINTHTATVKSLDFHSDFELVPAPSASGSAMQIRAFITWFDTFFSHDSSTSGQASSSQECSTEFFPDDAYERSIESVTSDVADVSFTTGPRGKPTHWKQVVFMLKQPVFLEQGELHRSICVCVCVRTGA